MKKLAGIPLLLMALPVLLLALVSCGEAAEPPTQPPAPTAATAPTQPPAEPTSTPVEKMEKVMPSDEELTAYAAQVAGGPGAIYVGDLSQLAGPAPEASLGGIDTDGKPDGSVPLESLERHRWIMDI